MVSQRENPSAYNAEFARVAPSLTWAIISLTWPLYVPICRHRTARWLGLFTMAIVYGYLVLTVGGDRNTAFEFDCLKLSGTPETMVQHMSQYVLGSFALLFAFVYFCYCIRLCYRPRRSAQATRWPRWVVGLTTVWCITMFALMHLSLVTFSFQRTTISWSAGSSLEENKWGFGQVMALTAWFPTVLDFGLVFRGEQ